MHERSRPARFTIFSSGNSCCTFYDPIRFRYIRRRVRVVREIFIYFVSIRFGNERVHDAFIHMRNI